MDVVALLSPPLLSHLRIALATSDHTVTAVTSWDQLDDTVKRLVFDVAVIDPAADGGVRTSDVVSFRQSFPSLPFVAYTVLAPAALKAIVELARCGVEHVVLFRFDDEPRRLRDLIERQPGYVLSERVLEQLAPSLSGLSPALARAVERMFRRPHQFFGTEDLAAAAGLTRRTVYRQVELAGLASPRVLVLAARLLRAFSYMWEPGHTIEDVATKMGYSSPRIFVRHVRETIGLTPSLMRRRVSPEEFVQRLVSRLHGEGRANAVRIKAHAHERVTDEEAG